MLYAARATQGIGAALLSPAALSILTATFTGERRASALGAWGAIGGAGAAAGVLLGGVLTELIGWRSIFFINLPIGVIAGIGLIDAVAPDTRRPQWRGLDLRGAAVATASLAALLFALAGAAEAGWAAPRTFLAGLGGVAGLGVFATLERRTRRPLLRLRLLADRAVAGGSAAMPLASASLIGGFLLTSLYLQEVLGYSPLQTGLQFLPIALAAGAGAHLGGKLAPRLGVRLPMAGGFVLAAAGMLLLTGVSSNGSYAADILPGMLLASLGLGVVLVSVAIAVLTGAREDDAGTLSGLNTTGHEVGGALGIALLTTIVAQSATSGARPDRIALATGLGHAFATASVLAGVGVIVAAMVVPAARAFVPRLRASTTSISIH